MGFAHGVMGLQQFFHVAAAMLGGHGDVTRREVVLCDGTACYEAGDGECDFFHIIYLMRYFVISLFRYCVIMVVMDFAGSSIFEAFTLPMGLRFSPSASEVR